MGCRLPAVMHGLFLVFHINQSNVKQLGSGWSPVCRYFAVEVKGRVLKRKGAKFPGRSRILSY